VIRLGWMYWQMAWSASFVVPLRLMRMSSGGPEAVAEAVRMVTEKQTALVEGMVGASRAAARGADAVVVAAAAARPAERRLRANLRRLQKP